MSAQLSYHANHAVCRIAVAREASVLCCRAFFGFVPQDGPKKEQHRARRPNCGGSRMAFMQTRPSSSSTGRMSHPIGIRRTIDYSPCETQTQAIFYYTSCSRAAESTRRDRSIKRLSAFERSRVASVWHPMTHHLLGGTGRQLFESSRFPRRGIYGLMLFAFGHAEDFLQRCDTVEDLQDSVVVKR
jgi:hypothetical protein